MPRTEVDATLDGDMGRGSLRSFVLTWEKLRIVYNALLFGTVLLTVPDLDALAQGQFLRFAAVRCLEANVLFMVGPGIDAYCRGLGLRSRWVVATTFLLVSLVSVGLVVLEVHRALVVIRH